MSAFISSRLITLATALSLNAFAAPQGPVNNIYPPFNNPPQMGNNPGYCQVDQQSSILLRNWYQNTVLPLRQLFQMGMNCQGRRISQVIVNATTNGNPAQIVLLVNGQAASLFQYIGVGQPRPYAMTLPPGMNEIGTQINTLQVSVQGAVYIDSIQLVLDNCGQPGGGGQLPGYSIPLGVVAVNAGPYSGYLNVDPRNGNIVALDLLSRQAPVQIMRIIAVFANGQSTVLPGLFLQPNQIQRVNLLSNFGYAMPLTQIRLETRPMGPSYPTNVEISGVTGQNGGWGFPGHGGPGRH
ncbi:MAG: hypothetical protein JST16_16945 [Bdellovibrionales bacterium]|nr:hypothetical protein [Bdellovibrionales bacterium]